MKLPLCQIDIKSGFLCPRCQSLVDKGEYDEWDLKVMKALLELEESKMSMLKEYTYYKSIASNGLLVVIISGPKTSPYIFARIGKALSEKLKIKVRVVEKTSSLKQFAGQLLAPAQVVGVNMLWLPDGSWEGIVLVSRHDVKALPVRTEVLEEVLTKINGFPVKIRTT